MKRFLMLMILAATIEVLYSVAALASQVKPDQFLGDTAIYGGAPTVLQPNVLIIIDNSGSMGDTVTNAGTLYDKDTAYDPVGHCTDAQGFAGALCDTNAVYDQNYVLYNADVSKITHTCGGVNPMTTLQTVGQYSGKISSSGTLCAGASSKNYFLGNYINWIYDASSTSLTKIDIANTVMSSLVQGTTGVKFGMMTFFYKERMVDDLQTDATTTTITSTATTTVLKKTTPGTVANNSKSMTSVATAGLAAGDTITSSACSHIASGSIISSISGSTITMNNKANGTCTNLSMVFSRVTTTTLTTYATTTVLTPGTYDQGGPTSQWGAEGATFLSSVPTGTLPAYVTTVRYMDDIFSGTTTNRKALSDTIQTLTASNYTPLAESLYEASRYFGGKAPAFGATIGVSSGTYSSPIELGCQKNYIIFVTDGEPTADDNVILESLASSSTSSCIKGDCDGDGMEPGNAVSQSIANSTNTHSLTPVVYSTATATISRNTTTTVQVTLVSNTTYTQYDESHSLDDVAKYLYDQDFSPLDGVQNVSTYMVGFGLAGSPAVTLMKRAVDTSHGHGAYYDANSVQDLSNAFTSIIRDIFSVSSSFVAPVVPVSPENRTYSGSRVYMGFFKPEGKDMWDGNLKKYQLQPITNYITDVTGSYATFIDNNGDGFDDRDGAQLLSGTKTAQNGAFRDTAKSFWSSTADGGDVKSGGAGQKLLFRSYSITSIKSDISGTARNIYTFKGTNTDLTASINAFRTAPSGSITATDLYLGYADSLITSGTATDVGQLVNYIHGFDTYNNSTSKREWILGDILHSRPFVVNYATYDPDIPGQEADCTVNKSIVYLGSNDGMVHAIQDCDGNEAWAFIPPDVLPYLQYLRSPDHAYFVDSTIQSYRYDKNGNGTVDLPDDKLILLIGQRRGGGKAAIPTAGNYYALDVSDPRKPKFLWSFNNTLITNGTATPTASVFSDLGETWSEPKIVRININAGVKIAAFFGAGYDNCSEDGRYGSDQQFSGSCISGVSTVDGGLDGSGNPFSTAGTQVSTGMTGTTYKGRAVYAVEIASLSSGATPTPTIATSVNRLWGYTRSSNPPLEFSMTSEVTALDTNGDGYADRLYMGDAGGNMWRFDISSTNTNSWTATKVFTSNPGYSGYPNNNADTTNANGRKIFYKPAAFYDAKKVTRLFFGTGDREHPLNRAVSDRIYEVIDKGQTSAVGEHQLLDVTQDLLSTGTTSQVADITSKLQQAEDPSNTSYYGWYIRLDSGDWTNSSGVTTTVPYPGEKVLAPVTLDNGVVFATTYAPDYTKSTDPCSAGSNLGVTRLYAVDYRNGTAVFNYDTTNDSTGSYNTYKWNSYATSSSPDSGVRLRSDRHVMLGSGIPSGIVVAGDKVLIGCGAGICTSNTAQGAQVLPVYWKQQ